MSKQLDKLDEILWLLVDWACGGNSPLNPVEARTQIEALSDELLQRVRDEVIGRKIELPENGYYLGDDMAHMKALGMNEGIDIAIAALTKIQNHYKESK